MAFGMMVKKWGILQKPLTTSLEHVWELIVAVGQLHNHSINERLLDDKHNSLFNYIDDSLDDEQNRLREPLALFEYNTILPLLDILWSRNRDRMAQMIDAAKLTRPIENSNMKPYNCII
jgi:hypothetical protein